MTDRIIPLRDERLRLRLASSLTRLQVFTPPLRDYWCVEPVSHVPNAIGMADPQALGLKVLAPGEALSAWIELQVDPARLVRVLHFDGTPITARFIAGAIRKNMVWKREFA